MSYHGIQISGIALTLYGFVTAFVESTWTGVSFTPTGQPAAGAGVAVVLVGAILDPVLEKGMGRATR